MTPEKRRLRLARRQALLAQVSQRSAMRSLAMAVAEQGRSEALARRSHDLAHRYGHRVVTTDGEALAQAGIFAAALGTLATQAEQARADAVQQADWQAQSLGKVQTKAARQKERLAKAQSDFEAARARRDTETGFAARASLARDLQSHDSQSANGTNRTGNPGQG